MTQQQLEQFILNSNEIESIKGKRALKDSLDAWEYLIQQPSITIDAILNTHMHIMKRLNKRIAGKIRDCQVYVGWRRCPEASKINSLLSKWVEVWGKGVKSEIEAKQSHIEFEHIHPFEDGNGRTGRLLWLYHREKARLPYMLINAKTRFENYYKWF